MVWHVKLVSFPKQSSAWTSPPFYVPFVSKKRPVLLKSTSRQSWSRHVHCQMDMCLMISYVNCHQVRSGSEVFHVFILQYVGVHNLTFCEMGCQRQTAYCITRYFLLRKYHKTCPRLWKSSVLARRISCKCFLHVRKSLSPIQSLSFETTDDHSVVYPNVFLVKWLRIIHIDRKNTECLIALHRRMSLGIYDYQYPTKIHPYIFNIKSPKSPNPSLALERPPTLSRPSFIFDPNISGATRCT